MGKASQGKGSIAIIIVVSVVVPILVAFLFFIPDRLMLGDFVYMLPHFHAGVNTLTSLILLAAFLSIKVNNVVLHKRLMISAICLGALFLVSYVIYHSSVASVVFGDLNGDGVLDDVEKGLATTRNTYLIILLSHIGTSIVTLPLVLFSFYYALIGNFNRHKKFVRFAYPLWLYVSITGVIVYWMISPYYL